MHILKQKEEERRGKKKMGRGKIKKGAEQRGKKKSG